MKPEIIIRNFFKEVRSGVIRIFQIDIWQIKYWHIKLYLKRNKQYTDAKDYAEHVREMIGIYGNFFIRNSKLLVQDSKVYVRWKQVGTHIEK